MKKAYSSLFLAALLMLLFYLAMNAKTTLNIGSPVFPPYVNTMDNGKIGGLAAEIVAEVFHKMGVDYENRIYLWASVLTA